ncbi:hypothetical protein GPALN_012154 [Globodera pallida]|nr:hypothetical protein GPALN_012154 [Globodera pallida]
MRTIRAADACKALPRNFAPLEPFQRKKKPRRTTCMAMIDEDLTPWNQDPNPGLRTTCHRHQPRANNHGET